MEAASFIVSTVFPDKKLHGASFLARLSGSTAEMMSMWAIMMAGQHPFSLDATGVLQCTLVPVLPGWMFTDENTVGFTFLGEIPVTYHNPTKGNTWNLISTSATVVYKDGSSISSTDGILRGEIAKRIRSLEVASIDIFY